MVVVKNVRLMSVVRLANVNCVPLLLLLVELLALKPVVVLSLSVATTNVLIPKITLIIAVVVVQNVPLVSIVQMVVVFIVLKAIKFVATVVVALLPFVVVKNVSI